MLVWLVFLAAAAWNVRLIPFFAVVAGPITALNFLDFVRWKQGADAFLDPGVRRWAISGRLFTIVLIVFVTAVSLPGWLQSQPFYTRHIGWGVDVDQGLESAARQVAQWRTEGRITGDEHWFNTSPDVVNYFAWFCADEKTHLPITHGFFDQRLHLFGKAAEDFWTARQALEGRDVRAEGDSARTSPGWRKVFDTRKVRYLVFHQHNLPAILPRVFSNPDEWHVEYLGGRTAIFAWHEPPPVPSPEREPKLGIDFAALAFGKNAMLAPDERARPAGPRTWWQALSMPEKVSTADAGTACSTSRASTRLASVTSWPAPPTGKPSSPPAWPAPRPGKAGRWSTACSCP